MLKCVGDKKKFSSILVHFSEGGNSLTITITEFGRSENNDGQG